MDKKSERGMATAEYVVGTVGATVIATLLCTCGMGDHSFFGILLQSVFERVADVTDALLDGDFWRSGAMM